MFRLQLRQFYAVQCRTNNPTKLTSLQFSPTIQQFVFGTEGINTDCSYRQIALTLLVQDSYSRQEVRFVLVQITNDLLTHSFRKESTFILILSFFFMRWFILFAITFRFIKTVFNKFDIHIIFSIDMTRTSDISVLHSLSRKWFGKLTERAKKIQKYLNFSLITFYFVMPLTFCSVLIQRCALNRNVFKFVYFDYSLFRLN